MRFVFEMDFSLDSSSSCSGDLADGDDGGLGEEVSEGCGEREPDAQRRGDSSGEPGEGGTMHDPLRFRLNESCFSFSCIWDSSSHSKDGFTCDIQND